MEIFRECFMSSIIPIRPSLRVIDKSHYSWDKSRAKALFAYRTGSLKLKTAWKVYNQKIGVGIKCPMPMCPEDDTWDHLKQCPFYVTKWNVKWNTDDEIAKFIVEINRERYWRLKAPIL